MIKAEFARCFAVAKSNVDLSNEDIDVFWGCGLKNFTPISTTTNKVARLIRWQCQYLNGGWDSEALAEMADIARRKFTLID